MTTLAEIIQQAYRDANLIPIGSNPTTAEGVEGLERLQVIVKSVLGMEGGEGLSAFPIGSNNLTHGSVPTVPDYLPLNVRLVCNLAAATTLYLNPYPQDGSRVAVADASENFNTYNLTLNGNGRLVNSATTAVLSTNGTSVQYFYRDDLGDWVLIGSLASGDAMPFPEEFDDMFVIMLAMRLNPRNAQSVSQESVAMMERSREQFRARYSQTVNTPSDLAVRRLSFSNRYSGASLDNGGLM